MIAEFFAFIVIIILMIDVALHLTGKQTFSQLVHGLANQYIDYGIYAVIVLAVFLKFGLEAGLILPVVCSTIYLVSEKKI